MGSMASKEVTPQEQMREYKREIDRAVRELDRERRKMETQQTKLVADIKKAAKADQMGPVKIMARDYARGKKQIQKFYQLRTYMQGIGMQFLTMKSTATMSDAMKNATRSMAMMSRKMNLPQLQSIMRTFGMETERMEMTQEVMGDTMDGILEADDEEEEADSLVASVLAELKLTDTFAAVPTGGAAAATTVATGPARVATAATGGSSSGAGAPHPPPPGPGGDAGGFGASAPAPPAESAAASSLKERLANMKKGPDSGASGAGAP